MADTSPLATGYVPAETLQPQPTLNIPPASQDNTNYNAIINGTFSSADQQQLTQANNTQTAGVSSLAKLYADVGLKANDQAQMEADKGVQGMQTDVQNLTNTLNGLQAEANIIPLQAQKDAIGKGMTDRGLAPITTAQLRDIAIKTLTTSSLLQAKQGDLTLANSQIEKAISLKYAPKEAEIAAKEKLLELNDKYFITPLEKKRAEALKIRYEKEKQDLADKKAQEKTISDLIINANQQGAPQDVVNLAIKAQQEGKTPLEVANILGVYAGDYRNALLLDQQLKTSKAQEASAYASIRKSNVEAGLTPDGKVDPNAPVVFKPLTEGQSKDFGYARRMEESTATIQKLAPTIIKMNPVKFQTQMSLASSPLTSGQVSPEIRQYYQAVQNYITAKLRQESGASIAPSEFKDAYGVYIPYPGDDETTIGAKTQTRSTSISSLKANVPQYDKRVQVGVSVEDQYLNTVDGAVSNVSKQVNNPISSYLSKLSSLPGEK